MPSAARDRERSRGQPRARDGGRRSVHLRHRAPRVAAHRQPAARALRPPGRPGRDALLPLRRGRSRAAVRGRPHLQDPRPLGGVDEEGNEEPIEAGMLSKQIEKAQQQGRGAELPDPQARARIRRRDERAAARDLRLPRRGARGQGDGRARRASEIVRGDRAHDRAVHRRATTWRTGISTALFTAPRPVLPARPRPRGSRPRGDRPQQSRRTPRASRRWSATTRASRSSARS